MGRRGVTTFLKVTAYALIDPRRGIHGPSQPHKHPHANSKKHYASSLYAYPLKTLNVEDFYPLGADALGKILGIQSKPVQILAVTNHATPPRRAIFKFGKRERAKTLRSPKRHAGRRGLH